MNIVVLGPRASGKSTLSRALCNTLNIQYVSMGSITRREIKRGTEIGKKMLVYITGNNPYPENFLTGLVTNCLIESSHLGGFVLEGYPRKQSDAHELNEILQKIGASLDFLVTLKVPLEHLIERAKNRVICSSCDYQESLISLSTIYCPYCSAPLRSRLDDTPESINEAFLYYQQTEGAIVQILCSISHIHNLSISGLDKSETVLLKVLDLIEQTNH